nr:sugar phosphate isomerase/epimerase [bacterium]
MEQKMILTGFADEADTSFDGQLAALKDEGIGFIEIRGVDGKNIANLTDAELGDVKEKLARAGIRVSAIGSPIGKIEITQSQAEDLDKCKRVIDIARELGTPYVRMFSFFLPHDQDPAIYQDEVMERLEKYLALARGSGVKLCHENEGHIYGETPERCLDMMKTFGGELRTVLDPGNFILCGIDPMHAYELLKDYIEYLHIKDGTPQDGRVVVPGEGKARLKEVLAARLQANKPCFVSLEPHLMDFVGLSSQHQGGNVDKFLMNSFSSNREAFHVAAQALKGILHDIGAQ